MESAQPNSPSSTGGNSNANTPSGPQRVVRRPIEATVKAIQDIRLVCPRCNQEVKKSGAVVCAGISWHPPCFTCGGTGELGGGCKMPLSTSSQYVIRAGMPYCKKCYKNSHLSKVPISTSSENLFEALSRRQHQQEQDPTTDTTAGTTTGTTVGTTSGTSSKAAERTRADNIPTRIEVVALTAAVKVSERASTFTETSDKSKSSSNGGGGSNKGAVGPSGGSNSFGRTNKCPMCDKAVYKAEEVMGVSAIWHKSCFQCGGLGDLGCRRVLLANNYVQQDGIPYCRACFSRNFFQAGSSAVKDMKPTTSRPTSLRKSSQGAGGDGDENSLLDTSVPTSVENGDVGKEEFNFGHVRQRATTAEEATTTRTATTTAAAGTFRLTSSLPPDSDKSTRAGAEEEEEQQQLEITASMAGTAEELNVLRVARGAEQQHRHQQHDGNGDHDHDTTTTVEGHDAAGDAEDGSEGRYEDGYEGLTPSKEEELEENDAAREEDDQQLLITKNAETAVPEVEEEEDGEEEEKEEEEDGEEIPSSDLAQHSHHSSSYGPPIIVVADSNSNSSSSNKEHDCEQGEAVGSVVGGRADELHAGDHIREKQQEGSFGAAVDRVVIEDSTTVSAAGGDASGAATEIAGVVATTADRQQQATASPPPAGATTDEPRATKKPVDDASVHVDELILQDEDEGELDLNSAVTKDIPMALPFDKKGGVIKYIATSGWTQPFVNPHRTGAVNVIMSSIYTGNEETVVEYEHPEFPNYSYNQPRSCVVIDLGKGRRLIPTRYCVRHGGKFRGNALRNWTLLGKACKDDQWSVLLSHCGDRSLHIKSGTIAWWEIPVPPSHKDKSLGVGRSRFGVASGAAMSLARRMRDLTFKSLTASSRRDSMAAAAAVSSNANNAAPFGDSSSHSHSSYTSHSSAAAATPDKYSSNNKSSDSSSNFAASSAAACGDVLKSSPASPTPPPAAAAGGGGGSSVASLETDQWPDGAGFRYFKIVQTGPNSAGNDCLFIGGLDFYGRLTEYKIRA